MFIASANFSTLASMELICVGKKITRLTDEQKVDLGMAMWLCLDCKTDTFASQEYYMLWYRIWRSINYKIDGMLCLDCAEARLGRALMSSDFSKAPINEMQARLSPRLELRLRRGS